MSSTRSDTELIDLIDNALDGALSVTFTRLYQPEYRWQVGIKLQFEDYGEKLQPAVGRYDDS